MSNVILIIASGAALVLMLVFSFIAAYQTVFANNIPSVCQISKKVEDDGEVLLDDICEKYLKLTNLD